MIILDVEMSGVIPEKHGIWQIAAMDLDNPTNIFIQEGRIDEDEECDPQALRVIGKTENELRNPNKQSQKELLENFFKWADKIKIKNLIGQNVLFDYFYIIIKSRKHKVDSRRLPYRTFDTHTIAAIKYYELNNKFLIDPLGDRSGMNLTRILDFCGIKDNRRSIDQVTNKVLQEGSAHDALEDVKLTAECFSRIVYGKEMLSEFKNQPIPQNLKR
ncbi:MAG: exonuclease domain-containing protein [Candidatus Pacearchaeota archaeon]